MSNHATMHDVARRAGVSQSTVSLVLGQRATTVKISDDTRRRVLEAVEATGYRPNLAARSMKSRKSQQVGVLLENRPERRYTHPLTWEFVLGINEGLERGGHIMSLLRLTDVAQDGGLQASALQNQLLDGLIVVNYIPDSLVPDIEKLTPRCIWVDANVWRDERCIRRDEVHAGEAAAQALLDLGYRRLVCLIRGTAYEGEAPHYSFHQRMKGIRQAVNSCAGASMEEVYFNFSQPFPDNWQSDIGYIALDTYFMQSLLVECSLHGITPGRDCHVVCCDDHFHDAAYHWNAISRVSFDRFEMGRQAAEMMLQILQSPDEPCLSRLIRGEWQTGETASLCCLQELSTR